MGDNPSITHWPLLGPECEAFQGHHVAPNDIARGSWIGHLCESHFVNAILAFTTLFNPRCRSLRQFMVFANIAATGMMASHRWAHTNPSMLPSWVLALQKTGIVMSQIHHSR